MRKLAWDDLTPEGARQIVVATAAALGTIKYTALAGFFDIVRPNVVANDTVLQLSEESLPQLGKIISNNAHILGIKKHYAIHTRPTHKGPHLEAAFRQPDAGR